MIARRRRTDDKIQLARIDSGRLERLARSLPRQGRRATRWCTHDGSCACAGKNPLIRGIEELGQLVIGNTGAWEAPSLFQES